jgi:hypothetical protein
MNDSNLRTLAGIASGAISLSSFYGKSHVATMQVALDDFVGGHRYYTPDGVTYSSASGTAFGGMYSGASITTPSLLKLMCGSGSNATFSSDGGVTWSAQTLPGSTNYVNGSNGAFQLMPSNSETTTAYYSGTGTSWPSNTLPYSMTCHLLGSNGSGTLVGAAYTSGGGAASTKSIVSTSTGVGWSAGGALPYAENWVGVVWLSGTTYIAISANCNVAITTNSGSTWSAVNGGTRPTNMPTSMQGCSIATNGTGTIVVGSGSSGSTGIAYSTNGTTWTAVTLPGAPSGYPISVAYVNGFFLAAGYNNTNLAWKSTNGISWTAETLPATAYIQIIC